MTVFPRLSIRWRITLGSLIIAVLFFGIAAFAFRSQVSSILTSTTETLLKNDAAPVSAEILAGTGTIDAPGRGQLVSVVDPGGVVQQTTLPDDLEARLTELIRFPATPRPFTTDDGDYLILTEEVATGEGTWLIVTARNLETSTLLLDRLTMTLIVGSLGLAGGFGFASWMLTGAALRPVSRMRKQASELSHDASTEPLPVGPAKDELSALARTLNEFISKQRATALRERQMVSDASHELRSPIAILKGQLELAHLSSGNAVALEAEIVAAQRSVDRIASLASDLLELSQLEATPSTEATGFDALNSELGNGVDRARAAAAPLGIGVDFWVVSSDSDDDSHFDLDLRYPIAPDRFGRMLDNLCTNALHALPESGSLMVTLTQRQDALELRVEDDGPGVPAEFIPVAFDRFSRPDHARSQGSGGSGLGLAIVKAIVVDARGDVAIANRGSGGLAVTVTIPARTRPE